MGTEKYKILFIIIINNNSAQLLFFARVATHENHALQFDFVMS